MDSEICYSEFTPDQMQELVTYQPVQRFSYRIPESPQKIQLVEEPSDLVLHHQIQTQKPRWVDQIPSIVQVPPKSSRKEKSKSRSTVPEISTQTRVQERSHRPLTHSPKEVVLSPMKDEVQFSVNASPPDIESDLDHSPESPEICREDSDSFEDFSEQKIRKHFTRRVQEYTDSGLPIISEITESSEKAFPDLIDFNSDPPPPSEDRDIPYEPHLLD